MVGRGWFVGAGFWLLAADEPSRREHKISKPKTTNQEPKTKN
ncbi:hypothetical protein Hsw_2828 [Hymenobacter swuensis DY53]|uniref:Uncharacterized protein n=1 Tax=Hymenobacter swuensis DY53 TaxID=1227739 RepID=W8F0L3_9BACT|nr:hypothetical protein Hsw_2828 [Hymenobacter swuensis DY53]